MDGGGCKLSKIIDKFIHFLSWKIHRRLRNKLIGSALGILLCFGGVAAAVKGVPINTPIYAQDLKATLMTNLGLIVKEVTLVGRVNASSESIFKALEIKSGGQILSNLHAASRTFEVFAVTSGDLILAFNLHDARSNLEDIGWIYEAEIRRELPNRIEVRIKERSPFVLWQRDGEVVLIDREGKILTDGDYESFKSFLTVVGSGAEKTAGPLVDILGQNEDLFQQVRAAVRVGSRRWNLHFSSGLVVKLPEQDIAGAWQRFVGLEAEYGILSRDALMVDVRLPDRLFVELEQGQLTSFGLPVEDA